jgi:hypothetical protein
MERPRDFFKRYFVPHEGNHYTPHILQKTAALGILLLIMATFTAANIHSILLLSSDWLSSAILPAVLVDLTNDNRTEGDLGSLTRSALLDEAAALKAKDMAEQGYFAHNSPAGVTPWYWFQRVGYEYVYAGENLAVHFKDSDEVVDAWMESPGHRANIMNHEYTEIGIGTAKGEYKGAPTVFVVQLFGRPLLAVERAQVAEAMIREENVAAAAEPEEVETIAGAFEEMPPETFAEIATDTPATTTLAVEDLPPKEAPPAEEPVNAPTYLATEIATTSPFVTSGVVTPIATSVVTSSIHGESTPLEQAAGRPHMVFSLAYALIAAFVFATLVISIALEWREQRPLQVAYGAGLMAALWITLSIHNVLLSGALVV